jgi:hypothetical protein
MSSDNQAANQTSEKPMREMTLAEYWKDRVWGVASILIALIVILAGSLLNDFHLLAFGPAFGLNIAGMLLAAFGMLFL